ncbi:MAG: glycosyltransferase, partial [Kineosporiaceae bacterium]
MIPAYGGGDLLRAAVRSVLDQDSPRWRLTVIDDGGDDPDLSGFLAGLDDDRIRYRRNPDNLGINRNFQRCVDEARADLVTVLGGDDRLLPDYVRTVTEAAEHHPGAAWIHPAVRVIDGDGRPALPLADRIKAVLRPRVRGARVLGGERLAASLLQGNWMYFPSVAFRREVVQKYGFRPGYDVVLDLDLYLRMLFDGHQAVLLGHTCVEYRRHAASLSSTE